MAVFLSMLQNFLVNSILLLLCAKVFAVKHTKLRLLIAASFSAVFAFLFAITTMPIYIDIAMRAICALFYVLVAIGADNGKNTTQCFVTYLLMTFCFGGIVYGAAQVLPVTKSVIAISLILPFSFVLYKFVKRINAHKKTSANCYRVKIKNNGKALDTKGFYDSGNHLKDKNSGKIVHIVSLSLASQIMAGIDGGFYIEYSTIGSSKQLLYVFEVEQIIITKDDKEIVQEKQLCGVMQKNFCRQKNFEMLFNSEVFG